MWKNEIIEKRRDIFNEKRADKRRLNAHVIRDKNYAAVSEYLCWAPPPTPPPPRWLFPNPATPTLCGSSCMLGTVDGAPIVAIGSLCRPWSIVLIGCGCILAGYCRGPPAPYFSFLLRILQQKQKIAISMPSISRETMMPVNHFNACSSSRHLHHAHHPGLHVPL